MRINSSIGVQEASYDSSEAGEGLAIFFSQGPSDTGRYRFLVKARLDEGVIQVGEFYSSPPGATSPLGALSRMVAGAICPGARTWSVDVSCVGSPDKPSPEENPEIILASSKCCTGPVGLSRVNERYAYSSGSGTANFTVRAGMKITGIAAIGLTGGGSIVIAGGNTITVPESIAANPEPKAPIAPNSVIAFANVDWIVEYLESA